jgi:hypothetical protein
MSIKQRQAAGNTCAREESWPQTVATCSSTCCDGIIQPNLAGVARKAVHMCCQTCQHPRGVRGGADLQKERLKALVKSVQKKHINHTPHAHPQSPAQFLRGDNTVKIAVGLGARSARSRWGGDAAYTCCGVWVGSIRFACRRESHDMCKPAHTRLWLSLCKMG